MNNFWHIVVLVLALIALYLLLSSSNTVPVLQTAAGGSINGIKALQGR